jgi:hypothetical protein
MITGVVFVEYDDKSRLHLTVEGAEYWSRVIAPICSRNGFRPPRNQLSLFTSDKNRI